MNYKQLWIVALLSASLVAQELTWTRLMSAEFFYTFAFLVLSLAILGLGEGALLVRLFPSLSRKNLVAVYLSLAALMGIVGPVLVFKLGLEFSALFTSWLMLGKLVVTIFLLSSSFILGGMALAILFKSHVREIGSLYMADLIGAAGGVLLAILLMNSIGTPAAAFLIAAPILLAGILAAPSWLRILPLIVAGLLIVAVINSVSLLEPDRQERAPVIYKHWDAMAKIKLFDYGPEARGINIDNVANSPVFAFDGVWDADDTTDNEWSINVSYLINQFDSCTFLSLGSGGGGDVLQALAEGAVEIHAVEVNPHINYMMTHGDSCGYLPPSLPEPEPEQSSESETDSIQDSASVNSSAPDTLSSDSSSASELVQDTTRVLPFEIVTLNDFSGNIYQDPRVTVVSEDARTYIRQFENKFDLIYSLSSNTWAALGSGSFAFAENYIFTTEAFQDYWNALSDSGFLSMEHQVYMPRLVSSVIDALKSEGVADPLDHFAIYDLPQMHRNLLLFSKRPLTDSLRYYAYGPLTEEKWEQIHLLYPPVDSIADNSINQIVLNGWERQADSSRVDLSPATDNRPFVAQMGLWKNFSREGLTKIHQWVDFRGFPLSKLVMVIIMLVTIIIVVPLTLLPYWMSREKLRATPWLFYFAIGLGFMMIEIVLIQKYALFIGASIYSIATVLLTLLVSSGVGSRYSSKFNDAVPFFGIFIWLLLDIFLFGSLTGMLISLPIFWRAVVTALLITPLGFFMGMPFPKASRKVGELVDWGFAVNGAASVLGATFVVMFAMEFGFTAALILAAIVYLMAYLLMANRKAWT
ncbi:MAG: hypothetical protein P1R58_02760 [bacterium]|nr:hypothetical protein [bacterium]